MIDNLQVFDRTGKQTHAIRNIWQGCSGFLVGGGPSVNKFEYQKLGERGIPSLGINNIAGMVPVRAFVHGDTGNRFHHGIWYDPSIMKFTPHKKMKIRLREKHGTEFKNSDRTIADCPNVWAFGYKKEFDASTFFTNKLATWGRMEKKTKTLFTFLFGIRLCHYLGIRNLFLLGVDFQMPVGNGYAFNQQTNLSSSTGNANTYIRVREWMKELVPIAESIGLKIWNCNPESRLDCFPHIDFNEAIELSRNQVPSEPFDLSEWYTPLAPKKPKVEIVEQKHEDKIVLPAIKDCVHRESVIRTEQSAYTPGLVPIFNCKLHGECVWEKIGSHPYRKCNLCSDSEAGPRSDQIQEFYTIHSSPRKTPRVEASPLSVVCVCTGTRYGRHYVERLKSMVQRHLKIKHRFFCLTDTAFTKDDIVVDPVFPSWWNKLHLFGPYAPSGRILYFDLDTVIVGDITEIVEQANATEFSAIKGIPWYGGIFKSQIMSFDRDQYSYLWEKFIADPIEAMKVPAGDQMWINWNLKSPFQFMNESGSRIVHCRNLKTDELDPDTRIVLFGGPRKPDTVEWSWASQHWVDNCKFRGVQVGVSEPNKCSSRTLPVFECKKFNMNCTEERVCASQRELICRQCRYWGK